MVNASNTPGGSAGLRVFTDHYGKSVTKRVERVAEAVFAGRKIVREHGDGKPGFRAMKTKT